MCEWGGGGLALLCWEELALFGLQLVGLCRDPRRMLCLPSALLGRSTAAHRRGARQHLSVAGVECVFFNEEYMTCTWGSKEKLTANYSLYYW